MHRRLPSRIPGMVLRAVMQEPIYLIITARLLRLLLIRIGLATFLPSSTWVGTRNTTDPFYIITGALNPTPSVTVLASGNVGIGTTSPNQKLQVNGDLQVIAATNTGTDGIIFQPNNQTVTTYLGWAGITTTSNYTMNTGGVLTLESGSNPLVFETNGANERMRITSAGNVGIGTTSPSTLLTVAGEATINVPGTGPQIAANFNDVDFGATTSKMQIVFSEGNAYYQGITGAYNSAAPYMAFSVSSTANTWAEKMRITSAGNVGIGTTSPSTALSVQGSSSVSGTLTVGSVSVTPVVVSGTSNPNYAGTYSYAGTYNGKNYYQGTAGYIWWGSAFWFISQSLGVQTADFYGGTNTPTPYLGTTWTSQLGATGSVTTSAGSIGNTFLDASGNVTAGGVLTVQGSGSSSFVGNVGIGTTNPTSDVKADINGAAQIAGTGSEVCATMADVGKMRFNPSKNYFEICSP